MYLATVVGLGVLVAGVALYLYGTQTDSSRRHSVQVVAWLVMALAPVFLVFTYFPGSSASGTLSGFSIGGAFAAFVLIWWLGSRRTIQLQSPDAVSQELDRERQISATLREQMRLRDEDTGSLVLAENRSVGYSLVSSPAKQVVIVTGDIERITFADLWVNSENCEMEMSRFFEDTLSARIRYCGAVHDTAGDVIDDLIADELVRKMADKLRVVPGTVISTGAGSLEETHGVRAILHVAAVQGVPGVGYIAVPNIDACVRNVLRSVDDLGLDPAPASIVLPLLGAGTGQAGIEPTSRVIVSAVLEHLGSEDTWLTTVYLLAYRERELEVLRKVLEGSGQVVPLSAP